MKRKPVATRHREEFKGIGKRIKFLHCYELLGVGFSAWMAKHLTMSIIAFQTTDGYKILENE